MKRENIDVVDIPMVVIDERLVSSKRKKKKNAKAGVALNFPIVKISYIGKFNR